MKSLVVFTYAPAGLGHIRVADALISGLPQGVPYLEFAPADKTTETTHRLTSLNVPARRVMEFFQRGLPEVIFTKLYVNYLKKHSVGLFQQFLDLINSLNERPEKIVVVATHFGLAYQLGAIKSRLEKALKTKIVMVIQITDDSPQIVWYVDSADLIVAPSHKTKDSLQTFAAKSKLRRVPIEVTPYPVSLEFAKRLSADKITNRKNQYDPLKMTPINIAIPVSGAAVGMEFFLHLMARLRGKSNRFVFHVICRRAPFTRKFLDEVSKRGYVKLYVSSDYKAVVEMHQRVYQENVIAAEITKPSEQAFKVLLSPDSVGGSFLFLAQPVGRQEYDNIDFLTRHGFLAEPQNCFDQNIKIRGKFTSRAALNEQGGVKDPESARGCILPMGSKASADLIWNLLMSGKLLSAFTNFAPPKPADELGDDGVTRFWKAVCAFCADSFTKAPGP